MDFSTGTSINAGSSTLVGAGQSRVTANATNTCCCPSCGGLECLDRTRFFAGQLLTQADLNNEQSYWLAKNRLHNRYLVGWGVVCGLQVSCGECDGWVVVQPGYAIDPCGNDIIVCETQNFNVLKAIQECCAPAKKAQANCSPLRYNPDPACKESKQEWCITIRYREQASRMVTPLTKATSQSAGNCTCGSGCGTGSTSATTSSSSSSSCEPTRIVEGFELGVVLGSEVAAALLAADPYSMTEQVKQCVDGIMTLYNQAPYIKEDENALSAYTAACNYLNAVRQFFASADRLTRCSLLDRLSAIKIDAPTKDQERGTYTGIVAELRNILQKSLRDCLCYALAPPCKPAPCDDRIVLACVTIQNGKILDICHFPGRKQVVTLQTLGYWLGTSGADSIKLVLEKWLYKLCCKTTEEARDSITFNNGSVYDNEAITAAGLTSGAAVNRLISHYIAQAIGAQAVNALNPNAQAVDLRPLVNQDAKTAAALLKEQGFTQVTVKSVDGDPSWTADAVDASAQFAPAAVSTSQPLVVYTKGSVVVGVDVVDSTAKILDLQNQIDALKIHLSQTSQTAAVANTTTDKS
jgi:hypothetical protein